MFAKWKHNGPALNLAAGYFSILSTCLYGLATIPVAVHFLNKEQLGLWNLLSQLASYLLLFELGLSTCAARILAPALASNEKSSLTVAWSTLLSLLALAGVLISATAIIFSSSILSLFEIPHDLFSDARWLWVGLALLFALNFSNRAYVGVLFAQDRYHCAMLIAGVTPWVQWIAFAAFLSCGLELKAYPLSMAIGQLSQWIAHRKSIRSGTHDLSWQASAVSWQSAKPMLKYSASMSLWSFTPVALGSIPSFVLTRQLGLEPVSMYTITNRMPQMLAMLALRSYHAFLPRIQSLYVNGQLDAFSRCFRNAGNLSIHAHGWALACSLLCNAWFVSQIARPDFFAGQHTTFWLVVGFLVAALVDQFGSLFVVAGRARWLSAVTAIEVLVTLVVSAHLCDRVGIHGVAAGMALCPLLIRLPYLILVGPRSCSVASRSFLASLGLALLCSITLLLAMQTLMLDGWSITLKVILALCVVALNLFGLLRLYRQFKSV